jgi:hypothetical protein
MANLIRIQILSGEEKEQGKQQGVSLEEEGALIEVPLVDDPSIEYMTEFTSFSELVPNIVSDFFSLGTTIQSAGSGTIGQGWLAMTNLLDLPRWKSTSPARITVKLSFYTKTNPEKDVWGPTKRLISMTILTKQKDGTYILPGMSLATAKDFNKIASQDLAGTKTSGISRKSKLISLEIPGIIYANPAIITQAQPIYSKQVTESGFPLWATLELTIITASPASTSLLDDVEIKIQKSNKAKTTKPADSVKK